MKLALLSGAHSHTTGYLKTIEQRDDLELAVVWDDMPSRGEAIAEQMGCPFVPNVDDALATAGLEATCICADNAGHRPLVEASAAAGLPIFCEKPMALSIADADSMLAAIRKADVPAVFGFFQPYTGAALAARKLIAEDEIGDNKPGETKQIEVGEGEPTRLDRLVALLEGKLDRAEADHDLDCCRDAVAISVAAYASSDSGERVRVKN